MFRSLNYSTPAFLFCIFDSIFGADCAFGDVSFQAFLLLVIPIEEIWTLLNSHVTFVAIQEPFASLWMREEFNGIGRTHRERTRRGVCADGAIGDFRRFTFRGGIVPMQIGGTIHGHGMTVVTDVVSEERWKIRG